MKISSSAFSHEGKIPSKYTCDGDNISPPLTISDVPSAAKSLVLVMDDPDVPKEVREDGMWDHWVVFNIPTNVTEIPEGEEPPGTAGMGTNGSTGYYGPCPPDREHRYFIHLFALDTELELPEKSDKVTVERAMTNHVIDKAYMMGLYERS